MTVIIKPEYIYLSVTIILMAIQLFQWLVFSRLKKDIEDLWQQISIIAITAGSTLQKLEKKIDDKQDK
jgi:hypothetical protein